MENRIQRNQCVYGMSAANEPVLKVKPGSMVIFETNDCFENQITSVNQSIEALNWEHINPATGPLWVEGAEPGDILKVEIQKIGVNDYGVMAAIPGGGLLGEQVSQSEIRILPVDDDQIIFNEKIRLPLQPMIGVIGVAPAEGVISCGTPGSHGGNMDNARIVAGTTIYLPVQTPGALLALGDLHACMGDGEIMVTGVEIAGAVQVQVDLLKGRSLQNPLLEDANYFYTIASHEDLLTAVKHATADMHTLIMRALRLQFNETGMLLSAVGDVQVCQVVDPLLTARFAFPKRYLPENGIL